eukprot:COSAG06_NODE_13670_length_1233_cov_0.993827_1_plen_95_part_10
MARWGPRRTLGAYRGAYRKPSLLYTKFRRTRSHTTIHATNTSIHVASRAPPRRPLLSERAVLLTLLSPYVPLLTHATTWRTILALLLGLALLLAT